MNPILPERSIGKANENEQEDERCQPSQESSDSLGRVPENFRNCSTKERSSHGGQQGTFQRPSELLPSSEKRRNSKEDGPTQPHPATDEAEAEDASSQPRREKRDGDPPMNVGGHRKIENIITLSMTTDSGAEE
ncbi:MAG: hypothetical protein EOM20_15590 [Spartobacteria bacterium]|nr:hypothetical protein [Spartobacteria bacterium]